MSDNKNKTVSEENMENIAGGLIGGQAGVYQPQKIKEIIKEMNKKIEQDNK